MTSLSNLSFVLNHFYFILCYENGQIKVINQLRKKMLLNCILLHPKKMVFGQRVGLANVLLDQTQLSLHLA